MSCRTWFRRAEAGGAPSLELIERLAKRLGVPPSYFLEVRRAGTIAVLEQEPQLVNRLHQELCNR